MVYPYPIGMAVKTHLTGPSGSATVKDSEIRRAAGLVDEEQANVPHTVHTSLWGFVSVRQQPMLQVPPLPETPSVAYRSLLRNYYPSEMSDFSASG